MSEGFSSTSQLDLDQAEKDERDLQIAVAGSQRIIHDPVLQEFLSEMRKVGEKFAVYGQTEEARVINRAKVMVIDELRAYTEAMAKVNQHRQEDEERARSLE